MKQQRGSTLTGFVAGVVTGLALALGVAVYITKVPIPFVRESPSRTSDQDADEQRKNTGWDPNAPLYGKNPSRPASEASASAAPTPGAAGSAASSGPANPAAVKASSAAADPLGDLVRQKTATGTEGSGYFVQSGAFNTPEDAEAQRAKLSLAGLEAHILERDQSGRTVYRVRVGPLDSKDEADKVKARVEAAGFEAALIKTQRCVSACIPRYADVKPWRVLVP